MLGRIAKSIRNGWTLENTGDKDPDGQEIVNLVSPHKVIETAPGENYGKEVPVRIRVANAHVLTMSETGKARETLPEAEA